MKTALLFPGQGSQKVGMGHALAQEIPAARRVFEEADDALGFAISDLCFEGPADKLTLTPYTQPAILTCSIAALRALQDRCGRSDLADLSFDVCAGHSLGEFSALVAAGVLSLGDAVRLVHLRGQAMQEAVPAGVGAMAAIMGLDLARVRDLCDAVKQDQVCSPANLNGGQIVVSGHKEAVERAVAEAKGRGATRAILLAVSAPFHCELMGPAAERLAAALEEIPIGDLTVPVIANVDAAPNGDPARVKDLLVRQVTSAVRWEESMKTMIEMGVTEGIELGSGTVLRGLARRIVKSLGKSQGTSLEATFEIHNIGEPEHVMRYVGSAG